MSVIEDKYICYECLGEDYLKREVENKGDEIDCSYCDNIEIQGISLTELAHRIDTAFSQHYIRSSDNPPEDWSISRLKNLDFWEPDGTPIVEAIEEAADVTNEIACDIQEFLAKEHYNRSAAEIGESSDYDDDSYYDVIGANDIEWQRQWTVFENTVKTSARFFSKDNERLLHSIFDKIDFLETSSADKVVKVIGPESKIKILHRARAFQSDAKLKTALEAPDKEIGPPPAASANAGRMNARGISVFYGSTDYKTALAEIRPPVGSKVVVASFKILRALKVLDLTALTSIIDHGSIFDENYAERLAKSMFLRTLSAKMTKAVMPDDEHSEYLTTQVIADFLASELKFDGIMFSSAQFKSGVNITLFHHASGVKKIENPVGTTIEASLLSWDEDGELPDYSVDIQLPEEESKKKVDLPDWIRLWDITGQEIMKLREDSVEIDTNNIIVHHITSIDIHSEEHCVEYNELKRFNREDRELLDF